MRGAVRVKSNRKDRHKYLNQSGWQVLNQLCVKWSLLLFDLTFIPAICPVKGLTWTFNKVKGTTIDIKIVGRAITLEPYKKKQRTDTKKDAKRIKSDNFTRSNKEKSNIDIAILEKLIIEW